MESPTSYSTTKAIRVAKAASVCGLIAVAYCSAWETVAGYFLDSHLIPFRSTGFFSSVGWFGIVCLAFLASLWLLASDRNHGFLSWKIPGMLSGFGAILLLSFFTLTDLGILVVGHEYWLNRAWKAHSDAESRLCLRIVYKATQYGVDIAENSIADMPAGTRRRFLAHSLCEMTGRNDCEERLPQLRSEFDTLPGAK